MKYVKLLGLSLMIMLGLKSSLLAQPTVLTGTTTRQASQLVLWYDQVLHSGPLGRFSFIQVTNGSSTTGVRIHVQFFRSFNSDFGNPATAVLCDEREFNDFLTPNDTVIYDLFDIERNCDNPPTCTSGGGSTNIDVLNTKGFVVVTAVNVSGEAISHQHLFGNSHVFDLNNVTMHRLNAMGRDAVDFNSPFPITVVSDGTVLDGVNAGLVLVQPETLKFNFESTFTKSPFYPNLADIIGISFKDNYDAGQDGAYAAEPGSVTWENPFIIDLFEHPKLCDNIVQDCFFDIGLNEEIGVANPLLHGEKEYCPGNFTKDGWARTEVVSYDGFENEFGIVAISTSNDMGDAYWVQPGPFETPPSSGLAGDANGDGVINILDVTVILNDILEISPAPGNGDCNGDGQVNILDVTCVLNIILGG
jgi:hypothetical protein